MQKIIIVQFYIIGVNDVLKNEKIRCGVNSLRKSMQKIVLPFQNFLLISGTFKIMLMLRLFSLLHFTVLFTKLDGELIVNR